MLGARTCRLQKVPASTEGNLSEKITQEGVIRAFLDASYKKSCGAASLSDIASQLGIKKASLYNHFESREDIITKTLESCASYMEAISFIPENMDGVAKKYPADTVLKGIAGRYIKMHEKSPMLEIYTFLESQKYFDPQAKEIVSAESRKLVQQTITVLTSLEKNGKISAQEDRIHSAAVWFCAALTDLMKTHMILGRHTPEENRKDVQEKHLEQINHLIEYFTSTLQ